MAGIKKQKILLFTSVLPIQLHGAATAVRVLFDIAKVVKFEIIYLILN